MTRLCQFNPVSALNDVVDTAAGTRSLTLKVHHLGLIWTGMVHPFIVSSLCDLLLFRPVVAFDAHVLRWMLDENPPDEYARHHIKKASFYGIEDWTVDLVVKVPEVGDMG
jgi:hypothetical protein